MNILFGISWCLGQNFDKKFIIESYIILLFRILKRVLEAKYEAKKNNFSFDFNVLIKLTFYFICATQ